MIVDETVYINSTVSSDEAVNAKNAVPSDETVNANNTVASDETVNAKNAGASESLIAATVCLIPWEMDYEGVRLKTAQLEMVLCHPDYRKRGLVSRLINRFMDDLQGAGYDVSIIWGIPYYYRKYGYTYCHYGNGCEILPAGRIPDLWVDNGTLPAAATAVGAATATAATTATAAAGAPSVACDGAEPHIAMHNRYSLRRATEADATALTELYGASIRRYQLYLTRDEAYWRYIIRDAKHPVWMVANGARGNQAISYIIYSQSDDAAVRIMECGANSYADGLAILRLLKKQCNGTFYVGGPAESVLVKLARSFGSIASQPEQWLMRITDIPAFFRKIAPALEKRLEASDCAGATEDIVINLYKRAYRISFIEGKFAASEDIGFRDYSMGADGGDLLIPQDAFVRLAFGFRQLDQLLDAWPDMVINPSKRRLVTVLFPTASTYISTPYHFMGKIG
jgi:predicted acetyltransferase